jgi:hypothetical protein
MYWGPAVGLLGDLLTFTGGILLAWDVVQKERELQEIARVTSALKLPGMIGLNIEYRGVLIKSEIDIVHAFIRRSARKAAWGCVFLAFGFLLLLVSRIIELGGPSVSGR